MDRKMEKGPYADADKYFEKHSKVAFSQKGIEAAKDLSFPLANVEFENKGNIEIANGDFGLDLEYFEAQQAFDDLNIDESWEVNSWREVKSLSFRAKNGNLRIDLSEILPDGYRVIFQPKKELEKAGMNHDDRFILLLGDITNFNAIIILLHEAGHAWDLERLKSLGKDTLFEQGSYAQGEAEDLRQERAAWAYALMKIKPFIGEENKTKDGYYLTKEKVFDVMKLRCLGSYAGNLSYHIASRRANDHFAKDYFDDDAWLEEQEEFERLQEEAAERGMTIEDLLEERFQKDKNSEPQGGEKI